MGSRSHSAPQFSSLATQPSPGQASASASPPSPRHPRAQSLPSSCTFSDTEIHDPFQKLDTHILPVTWACHLHLTGGWDFPCSLTPPCASGSPHPPAVVRAITMSPPGPLVVPCLPQRATPRRVPHHTIPPVSRHPQGKSNSYAWHPLYCDMQGATGLWSARAPHILPMLRVSSAPISRA